MCETKCIRERVINFRASEDGERPGAIAISWDVRKPREEGLKTFTSETQCYSVTVFFDSQQK